MSTGRTLFDTKHGRSDHEDVQRTTKERPGSANYHRRRPKTSLGFVGEDEIEQVAEMNNRTRPKSARGNRTRQVKYSSNLSDEDDADVFDDNLADYVDYNLNLKDRCRDSTNCHDVEKSSSLHSNTSSILKQSRVSVETLTHRTKGGKTRQHLRTNENNNPATNYIFSVRSRSFSDGDSFKYTSINAGLEKQATRSHLPSQSLLTPTAEKLIEKYRSRVPSTSSEENDQTSKRPPAGPRKLKPLTQKGNLRARNQKDLGEAKQGEKCSRSSSDVTQEVQQSDSVPIKAPSIRSRRGVLSRTEEVSGDLQNGISTVTRRNSDSIVNSGSRFKSGY